MNIKEQNGGFHLYEVEINIGVNKDSDLAFVAIVEILLCNKQRGLF